MQMAEMFGVNPQAISKHIQNIYKEKELERKATSSKMELVQSESGRKVRRQVDIYNLDILISVGYRISSKTGTKFRQWATKILHSHIVKGFTINKRQLAKNYNAFLRAVEEVKTLLPSGGTVGATDALELVKMFANTWFSLDAYDKENLPKTGVTKKEFQITAKELTDALSDLKIGLEKSGQASDLFGVAKKEQSIDHRANTFGSRK